MTRPDVTPAASETIPASTTTTEAKVDKTDVETAPDTKKQLLIDAGGALATAVTIGLQQTGRLGSAPFSLQVTGTVAGLSAYPALYRGEVFWRLPASVRGTLIVIWAITCFLPSAVALIIELFTGHRRENSNWFDALWRVYAILALWIGFAVVNERFIRPWWRRVSNRWFGAARANSVAVQNQRRAMDKRTMVLEGIKARVVLALRRKKRAETMMEKRENDATEAAEEVRKAEELLENARLRSGDGENNESVQKLEETVETAKVQERVFKADVDRFRLDLETVEDELKMLQHEWTGALHIETHVDFAR